MTVSEKFSLAGNENNNKKCKILKRLEYSLLFNLLAKIHYLQLKNNNNNN